MIDTFAPGVLPAHAPYSYQAMNAVEGEIRPSFVHVHNTALAWMFKKYLMQEAISKFEWKMPEHWDSDYFRYGLFGWGFLAIFKTDRFGIIPQMCRMGGERNVFYRPTMALVSNPLINTNSLRIGTECEIIRLMPDYGNVSDIVDYYGDLMALVYESAAVNILNSKVSFVFRSDDKAEADTYKALYDNIAGGKPAVVYKRKKSKIDSAIGDDWKTFEQNVGQNYIAKDLIETLRDINDLFLTDIGIPTLSTRKKERTNLIEASKNDDATQCKADLWFYEMKECLRKIWKMFPELKGEFDVRRKYVDDEENGRSDD